MMSPADYAAMMKEEAAAKKAAADSKEAHMENLYGWICRQACQEKAVASLEDYALRDLNGWLARTGNLSGVPGLIHGLILVEAAERFMKMSNAKAQRTPRAAEEDGGPVS